jgi:hypothetical protein
MLAQTAFVLLLQYGSLLMAMSCDHRGRDNLPQSTHCRPQDSSTSSSAVYSAESDGVRKGANSQKFHHSHNSSCRSNIHDRFLLRQPFMINTTRTRSTCSRNNCSPRTPSNCGCWSRPTKHRTSVRSSFETVALSLLRSTPRHRHHVSVAARTHPRYS